MPSATPSRAEYLKSAERQTTAVDATITARWGDDAGDTSQSTALAIEADAIAEAARQLAYLGRTRARDVVTIEGIWFDLEGETVALPYDGRLGVSGLVLMLVLRTKVDPNTGTTEIEGEILL